MQKIPITHTVGVSAVEVLVGVAVITFALLGTVSAYGRFITQALRSSKEVQADYLLQEGVEAARSLRDQGWASSIAPLTAGTSYRLALVSSAWQATSTPVAFIGGVFERTVSLESVARDGNDDIAASGTNDTNSRKVTVNVSWQSGNGTTTRSLSTYITNLFGT